VTRSAVRCRSRKRTVVGEGTDSETSDRIRAARERLGWSREELAVHSGVSWSAISQAESGRRRNLRPQTLSRLSGALHVSIDYLVNGGPAPSMLTHQALLYEGEEDFVAGATHFLLEGIERSEAALVMTGKQNLKRLRKRLGSDASRVELVDSSRGYTTPEVPTELFTRFMLQALREGAVWIRIVGEPPWGGRSAAQIRLWTRYESLINLIFAGSPMSILCPYDVETIDSAIVHDAHVTHPQTVQGGETIDSPDYRDPARFALE
jgi:transcriptional regulator with XRE-family HTH domain